MSTDTLSDTSAFIPYIPTLVDSTTKTPCIVFAGDIDGLFRRTRNTTGDGTGTTTRPYRAGTFPSCNTSTVFRIFFPVRKGMMDAEVDACRDTPFYIFFIPTTTVVIVSLIRTSTAIPSLPWWRRDAWKLTIFLTAISASGKSRKTTDDKCRIPCSLMTETLRGI